MKRWREWLLGTRWRWPAGWLLLGVMLGVLAGREGWGWSVVGLLLVAAAGWAMPVGRGLLIWVGLLLLAGYWHTGHLESRRHLDLPGRLALEGRLPVELEGIVDVSSVRIAGREVLLRLPEQGDAKLLLEGQLPELVPGDRVWVRGSLRAIVGARNPGEYDAKARFGTMGVGDVVTVYREDQCTILQRGVLPWWWKVALGLRAMIERNLEAGFSRSDETPALLQALVLGDRGALSAERREVFRETGTAHLFAVSGLHVGLVAGVLYALTRPLGARRHWWRAGITLLGAILYAMITGLSPSSVRATIMTGVVLAALCVGRQPFSLNTLFFAALLILLLRPLDLFGAGFQMSFVVVGALLILTPPLWRRWERWWRHDPLIPNAVLTPWQRRMEKWGLWVGGTGLASVVAWIGALPLSITYFQLVAPVGIPANWLLTPLAGALLASGLLTGLFGGLPVLGWVLQGIAGILASMVFGIVQVAAQVPGGSWEVSWRELAPRPAFQLTVLDLGEGAGNLIRSGENTWLIDAGHARDERGVILPFLRWEGVGRLDALCLTHGDSAHYGGALGVLEAYRPRALFDNAAEDRSSTRRAFQKEVAARERFIRSLVAGEVLAWGDDVRVRVLHPPEVWWSRHADNKALALLLDGGFGRVLLLSDLGFAGLDAIRRAHPDLRVDLVVHGECEPDPVLDPGLLLWCKPRLVVVHSGSAFGDQAKRAAWITALSDEVTVWDQREHGAVVVTWRGGKLRARGFRSGVALEWRSAIDR